MNRIFLLFAVALATSASVWGQASGLLTGRVIDGATDLSLSGVRVRVSGTALETYTTSTGRYILPMVAEGEQAVTFDYVGYGSITRSVNVSGPTLLDVQFGDEVIEMVEDVRPLFTSTFSTWSGIRSDTQMTTARDPKQGG